MFNQSTRQKVDLLPYPARSRRLPMRGCMIQREEKIGKTDHGNS